MPLCGTVLLYIALLIPVVQYIEDRYSSIGGEEFRPHGGLLLSRDWRKSMPNSPFLPGLLRAPPRQNVDLIESQCIWYTIAIVL